MRESTHQLHAQCCLQPHKVHLWFICWMLNALSDQSASKPEIERLLPALSGWWTAALDFGRRRVKFEFQSIYIRDSRCRWSRWIWLIHRFTKYRCRFGEMVGKTLLDNTILDDTLMLPSCKNDRAVAARFAIEKTRLWCNIHLQTCKLRTRIVFHSSISQ